MSLRATSNNLAVQARRLYADHVASGMPAVGQSILEAARRLNDQASEHGVAQRRRDLLQTLMNSADVWQRDVVNGMRQVAQHGLAVTRPGELAANSVGGKAQLTLVDDDTIEREILTSRLALAIMDKASWEFTDLRSRVAGLEERAELEPHDLLRAHVLARVAVDTWRSTGMRLDGWRDLQNTLHEELAALVE